MTFSIKSTITFVVASLFVVVNSGCSHVVTIDSEPTGAEIYVNGQKVGNAPVTYTEKTGWDKVYEIEAKKAGYAKTSISIQQEEFYVPVLAATICAGLCVFPIGFIGLAAARQLPDHIMVSMDRKGSKSSRSKATKSKKEESNDNYDYGY